MGDLIKETVFKWATDFYRRVPFYGKFIFLVVLILVLFILGRNGILGEPMQTISKRIIPIYIEWIDLPQPLIQLQFYIDVKTKRPGEWERVLLDGSYPSDSQMRLSFDMKQSCWLLIIGVDSKKVYPIIYEDLGNSNYGATYFKPTGVPEERSFKLDGTIGTEAYIVVASYEKFNFKDQIKPALDIALKEEKARGPDFRYFLNLGKDFYQRAVYFNAVKAR